MVSIYEPLDSTSREIRVLQLRPAQNEADDIHCNLRTISIRMRLRRRMTYEALSYTWGPSEPKSNIRLNGSTFEISPNLDLALRRLRNPSTQRTLWIDAICINQDDVEERTQQVNLMREVYVNAYKVLVWLGESDAHIDEAMDYISDIETPRDMHKDLEATEQLFSPISQGLTNFLNKPWWYRIWVVQEVIVADEEILIGCGHRWLSFDHVVETVREAVILNLFAPDGYMADLSNEQTKGLVRFMNFVIRCRRGWATSLRSAEDSAENLVYIEDVLWSTRGRGATDPRDQVYGVLGLVGDEEHGWFPADYTKSVEEVYQSAVIRAFQSSKNLCLPLHASKNRGRRTLPSWCVDFSMPSLGVSSQEWLSVEFERMIVEDDAISFAHDLQSGTLTIPGIMLGSITHHYNFTRQVSASLDDVLDFYERLLDFQRDAMKALIVRLGNTVAEDECAKGALFKTIFAGLPVFDDDSDEITNPKPTRRLHDPPDPEAPEYFSHYALLQDWFLTGVGDAPPAEFGWVLYILRLVFEWWKERALLVTELGFIGHAEQHVEAGDVLCFMWGCSMPGVLRPQADGSFRLVTFAWVHGMSREGRGEHELATPEPPVNDLARIHARVRELMHTNHFEHKNIFLC